MRANPFYRARPNRYDSAFMFDAEERPQGWARRAGSGPYQGSGYGAYQNYERRRRPYCGEMQRRDALGGHLNDYHHADCSLHRETDDGLFESLLNELSSETPGQ